jgi:outer membrane protein W
MWRRMAMGLTVMTVLAVTAPIASAQDQALNFSLGYFTVRGEDSRTAGDVLNADRCIDTTFACEPLLFDVNDFNNATVGAEWLVGLGDYFEVSAGVSYYQRTVPSIYEFQVNANGSEIEQDLKLRIIPIVATVRFVPTGRQSAFQPYIGAGFGLFNWRYTETGDFVDTTDFSIFRASYEDSGTKAGAVIVGGARGYISDRYLVGGEVRYQRAEADLSTDFVGDKIDLGGITYQATFGIRF